MRPNLRVADVTEMRHFAAVANGGLLHLHKVSDLGVFLQMHAGPQASKRSDDYTIIEAAVSDHRMRLNHDPIAEDCVVQNTSRSNRAARANFRFAEKLHAWLEQ